MRRQLLFLLLLLVIVLVWLWRQPSAAGRHFNRGLEARARQAWEEAKSHHTAALAGETFSRRAEAHSMRAQARGDLAKAVQRESAIATTDAKKYAAFVMRLKAMHWGRRCAAPRGSSIQKEIIKAEAFARRILTARWPAVKKIAKLLCNHRRITTSQVRAALQSTAAKVVCPGAKESSIYRTRWSADGPSVPSPVSFGNAAGVYSLGTLPRAVCRCVAALNHPGRDLLGERNDGLVRLPTADCERLVALLFAKPGNA